MRWIVKKDEEIFLKNRPIWFYNKNIFTDTQSPLGNCSVYVYGKIVHFRPRDVSCSAWISYAMGSNSMLWDYGLWFIIHVWTCFL